MMKKYIWHFLLAGFAVAISACNKKTAEISPALPPERLPEIPVTVPDTIPMATYNLSLLNRTDIFNAIPRTSDLDRQDYSELSGIAASSVREGLLYVHEDSGNSNEIYLTDIAGHDLGKLVLEGIANRDWEDIAVGPGPIAGKSYVYIADIGDNNGTHSSVFVYRFAEPDLTMVNSGTIIPVRSAERIELRYPSGPVNAEALMIDPLTRDLYILNKLRMKSILFVARYPQNTNTATILTPLAYLPFDQINSGDISADGTEILLRNTGQLWYWKRKPEQSIQQTLLTPPDDAPYAGNERQGEGVTFATDNSGYFTNSEIKGYNGSISRLSFYQRK